MDACQAIGEQFLGLEQVMQVGRREAPAGVAVAALVYGPVLTSKRGTVHVHPPATSEQAAVASHARGKGAVEDVHSASHALNQVFRRTHPHEVSWPVAGQGLPHEGSYLVHLGLRLSHAQPANRVSVKVHSYQRGGGLQPQVSC